MLNEQRIANGLPGSLQEDTALSDGCQQWASKYRPARGQYPHEELPTQPGYTPAGNEAAKLSDLDGEPGNGFTVGTLWGPLFNPWSGAAKHLAALMNPAATTVWYGATQSAACMGTSGSRPFTAPAFFSYPGNGATGVPIAENTGEWPSSPQQDVGLGAEFYGAPAIILWPEDMSTTLQAATLRSSSGAIVPVKLLSPFVLPTVKYHPRTTYTLTATWHDTEGANTVQTVSFTTAATDLNGLIARHETQEAEALGGGSVTPVLHGRTLTITVTGVAIGKKAGLLMARCVSRACLAGEGPFQDTLDKTLTLRPKMRIRLPVPPRGKPSFLQLAMLGFTVNHHHYESDETSLTLPRRR